MDKLKMQSRDVVGGNVQKIAALFPQCVTERLDKDGKPELAIDFDKLRAELSNEVLDEGEERYQFTWPDKRAASRLANTPTTQTLRPCREESVDFDTTQNLYIEGDNLDVLKVLRETYLGKVKMIYIDPPYNTGNDFVYNDTFAQGKGDFEAQSGLFDDEGNQTVDPMQRNTESNGRFHTDWLNMIYPRLKVARDLLSDDGVIFISIDDNEVDNLRKVCDEIFGVQNRLDRGALVWINRGSSKGFRKVVKNHEYILAYGKNQELVYSVYGENFASKLGELEHYCFNKPSEKNPFADVLFAKGCRIEGVSDITFTGFVGNEVKLQIIGGPMVFKNGILQNDVVLRGTFPYVNQIKDYFNNKPKGIPTYDTKGQEWLEIFFNSKGMPRYRKSRNNEIISSVIDESGIPNFGSEDIKELLGKKELFSFPKPTELLFHLISYFLPNDSLILDFFSGSATTAHAVMKLNAEDGGHRKFIMVQLPEVTDEKSEARKAGYKNICEIGKERIRRAGKQILESVGTRYIASAQANANSANSMGDKSLFDDDESIPSQGRTRCIASLHSSQSSQLPDVGFRVLKLDSSNMEDVYYTPDNFDAKNVQYCVDNFKIDRTNEDLLFQVMLDLGIELSAKIERTEIAGKEVWCVDGGYLMACFDRDVNEATITEIAKQKPVYFVMRDASAANDNVLDNFDQLFANYSPDTTCKIL